jgi:hypothetical protein
VVVGSQGPVRAGYVSTVRYEYATPFDDAFTGRGR